MGDVFERSVDIVAIVDGSADDLETIGRVEHSVVAEGTESAVGSFEVTTDKGLANLASGPCDEGDHRKFEIEDRTCRLMNRFAAAGASAYNNARCGGSRVFGPVRFLDMIPSVFMLWISTFSKWTRRKCRKVALQDCQGGHSVRDRGNARPIRRSRSSSRFRSCVSKCHFRSPTLRACLGIV